MAFISNGTTILDAGSFASGTVNADQILIKTITASSDSTIDFVNGSSSVVFDGTYPTYVFKFINIHPATYQARFSFQVDTGSNTSYNQTLTSTWYYAYHKEDGNDGSAAYYQDGDLAQSSSFKNITWNVDNGNDDNVCGELHMFSPSSTEFVKHWISDTNFNYGVSGDAIERVYCSGYFNTTTALTRVRFKFTSGNIDSGLIKLYGIKDS